MLHVLRLAFVLGVVALGVLPVSASAWVVGDEATCPAVGRYINSEYAFEVTIPRDLRGCPDSPVGMSDHGVLIRLSNDSSIDIFESYNALTFQTIDEAADWEINMLAKRSALDSFVLRSRTRT